MSTHIVAAGPTAIRHLCCGPKDDADDEIARGALDGIDDPVALVGDCPTSVESLWRTALQSLGCAGRQGVVVVHPSWWSPARIAVVSAAAHTVADDVVLRPRSWLLARKSPAGSSPAPVIVEIAEHMVVITGPVMRAQPRRGEPQRVADAVARLIAGMTANDVATLVIDAPDAVGGAGVLARMIADRARQRSGMTVFHVDDAEFQRLAEAVVANQATAATPPGPADGGRRRHRWVMLVVLVIATTLGFFAVDRRETSSPVAMATTFLVEGRVAVEVPAAWTTQRILAGPGSARVQITSPSDPNVALHITQSPVAAETLGDAAEILKRGIDAEPPGVFVDFNPSGSTAGRAAVTYREVRVGHDIRWTVLLDRNVRISIGCQSRPADEEAVRDACELAVGSARALS
ncbi:type VII secretion-associated protein [Mycobacterium kyorinense]|uniref:Type VII secretion-associated protein n=1 Tax=Mycobacterium kyorinense TaxID=487514 RepID=A0A1A2ZLW7_9MYCO|nr:type VII secretion-associated protein [Mycobacterium kyorinense]OBI50071.1 type VII secretion-associated protein [Mycobacterium kyorinense]